jgi:nitrite reductase (NADH) large subunit
VNASKLRNQALINGFALLPWPRRGAREQAAATPSAPAGAARSKWLWASVAGIGLSLAIASLAPLPYPQALEDPWPVAKLWEDGAAMQASGYTLLGITLVGLSFSLRKRWARLRGYDYRGWRFFHGCLGVLGLVVLVLHTGMRLGSGLNRWLMLDYLGLGLAGGLIGLSIGLGPSAGPAVQRAIQRIHLGLFWLFPVLLIFHILAVYYY